MEEQREMFTSVPNLVCICVDKADGEQKSGCFYHKYSAEAVPFSDVNELLILMDRFMDGLDYPQASVRLRSFSTVEGGVPERIREGQRVRTGNHILSETGKKGTFIVNVQYRQNATWQGRILWADTGKSCYFRSALELLKLIDSALDIEDAGSQDEQAAESQTKEE